MSSELLITLMSCLSPFLWIGTMCTFFHWTGKIPVRRRFSRRSCNGFKTDLWDDFNVLIEIYLCPWALLTSTNFRIFKMFKLNKVIEALFSNLLLLLIKEQWFAKKSLKWLAFSLKSVTKWSFVSRGGIIGTFFQLVKYLRILQ